MSVRWKPSVCVFINFSEVVQKRIGGVGHLDRHHMGHQLYNVNCDSSYSNDLVEQKAPHCLYLHCPIHFMPQEPLGQTKNLALEGPSISCQQYIVALGSGSLYSETVIQLDRHLTAQKPHRYLLNLVSIQISPHTSALKLHTGQDPLPSCSTAARSVPIQLLAIGNKHLQLGFESRKPSKL